MPDPIQSPLVRLAAETDELLAEIAVGWDDDLPGDDGDDDDRPVAGPARPDADVLQLRADDEEGTYALLVWRVLLGEPGGLVHRSIHGTVPAAAAMAATVARHRSIGDRDAPSIPRTSTADPESLATLERLISGVGDSFCAHASHRARVVGTPGHLDCQIWCRCLTASLSRGGE
jgi:hypothetical protein